MQRLLRFKHLLTCLLSLSAFGLVVGASTVDAADLRPVRDRDPRPCAGIALFTAAASDRLDNTLADLVTEGVITQDQADDILERLAEPASDTTSDAATPESDSPFRDRLERCAAAGANAQELSQAVSDLIGLDPSEVRERRAGGESLAEIAESQGVSREELIATIQAQLESNLDEAETNGRITAEEHAERLANLPDRINKIIDHHRGDAPTQDSESTPTSTT